MTAIEAGGRVRTIEEVRADTGELIPANSVGMVIGVVDNRLLIRVDDQETDTYVTAEVQPWEVRPA